jgi:hypothetical protein
MLLRLIFRFYLHSPRQNRKKFGYKSKLNRKCCLIYSVINTLDRIHFALKFDSKFISKLTFFLFPLQNLSQNSTVCYFPNIFQELFIQLKRSANYIWNEFINQFLDLYVLDFDPCLQELSISSNPGSQVCRMKRHVDPREGDGGNPASNLGVIRSGCSFV